jgi:hypothetical protein
VLRPREGWYFVVDEDAGEWSSPLAWCFGLAGECRLAVTIRAPFIQLYVHDRDEEIPFDTPEELIGWLNENEHQWEGLSPLGQQLMDHLLPGQVERWRDEGEDGPDRPT